MRGELVNTSSYSADNKYVTMYKAQEEANEETQNHSVIAWLVLLIGLVILLVCGMYVYTNKKND